MNTKANFNKQFCGMSKALRNHIEKLTGSTATINSGNGSRLS